MLGTIYNTSNAVTFVAQVGITILMLGYVRRRHTREFRPVFWLFGTFLVFSALTRLAAIVTFYHPVYRVLVLVNAIHAVAAMATLVLMIPLMPRVLRMPSAGALEEKADRLQTELREAKNRLAQKACYDAEGAVRNLDELLARIERFNRRMAEEVPPDAPPADEKNQEARSG